MALHEPVHHTPKTLAEGAVCFGCTILGLLVIAMAIQWLMGLVG